MGKIMKFTQEQITQFNSDLKSQSPSDIVKWALEHAEKPVITTNFRPYEAAILHVVSQEFDKINVVWCDTGYNTPETYKHAEEVINQLALSIDLYVPQQTRAHREVVMGNPSVTDESHKEFTEQVKLEPFRRAMEVHKPDVWFTNLRQGQTAHRDNLDILSLSKDGVLKVSPFYYWSDSELDKYLVDHKLPNEHNYNDPTKVLEHRECGLHL
jgi:phosphoadenosine phosphosulfate reductase